ncbi:methyltransferase domain-containing protein [Alphaproteobacteria bacterium]|nr:methyltransferase domain-containing protein [Alphaproteobacteria bacterium]
MTVHTPLAADDIRRAYRKWASHYDYTFALFSRANLKKVVQQFNHDVSGTILDVGVGTGLSLQYFPPHSHVTGIDLSHDMLEKARHKVRKHKLTHVDDFRLMDAANLDFPDAHFDGVLATYVLSVADNPASVMREMARVCKPNGAIYVFNHFRSEHQSQPILARIEKSMAPRSKRIGFHSDFAPEMLQIDNRQMQLVDTQIFGPMGLFTLMKFKKIGGETL